MTFMLSVVIISILISNLLLTGEAIARGTADLQTR